MQTPSFVEVLQKLNTSLAVDAEAADKPTTPEETEALYESAREHYESGRYAQALPSFRTLLSTDTLNGNYYFSVAACLHKMEQHEEAVMHYYLGYTVDPSLVLCLFHGADCLIKLNAWTYARYALVTFLNTLEAKTKLTAHRKRAQEMLKDVERRGRIAQLPPQVVDLLKSYLPPGSDALARNKFLQ